MRLADALRLADELGFPDTPGETISNLISRWRGERPACCALAGANIAAGHVSVAPGPDGILVNGRDRAESLLSVANFDDVDLLDMYRSRPCPAKAPGFGCLGNYPIRELVMHLYDAHHWSRTQIADVLDRDPRERR